MINIRMHGRGGQGVVTASKVLGRAAFLAGYQIRSFPLYGAERRGAPLVAFLRIDAKPVRVRCQIYHPDSVLVVDRVIPYTVPVTAGMKEGGDLVLNSEYSPDEMRTRLKLTIPCRMATLDALEVAKEVGDDLAVNTAMIGAYVKVTGLAPFDTVVRALEETLGSAKSAVQIRAAKLGYEGTKIKLFPEV